MHPLAERLQRARKAAALSLRQAAALIHRSHAAIRKYEEAEAVPSSDILLRLAQAYHVKIEYFFRPQCHKLGVLKFRKRGNLGTKKLQALEHEILDQIERRLEIEELCPGDLVKPFRIPKQLPRRIHHLHEIEEVASCVRKTWSLGEAPIQNMVDLFEEQGIRVFMIDGKELSFEGLAAMVGAATPIIVVGAEWPRDRQRFTLAHELGHFILQDRLASSIDEEVASHYFAGAFLLPRQRLLEEIGSQRTALEMRELELIKEKYGISMQAQCFRLRNVGVILESYLRRLLRFFKKHGWTEREPGKSYAPEQASVFEHLVLRGYSEGVIGEAKAASLLALSIEQFRSFRDLKNDTAY